MSTTPAQILLGIVVAGTPLVVVEICSRRLHLAPEIARKLVHAGSGVAAAGLAIFLDLPAITGIAIDFLVVMLILRQWKVWHSLYRTGRRSWGEVCFPVGVALTSLLAPTRLAYAAAILVMGLADTAAALVGSAIGRHQLPWSADKTYEGSAAFIVTALAIGLTFVAFGVGNIWLAVSAALFAALAESLTPYGFDNLTVPVAFLAVMH
jgi:phytol kinase